MSAAVDSPLALGLFRFGMRQVWMFELIDALPLFITLPFILPLAIISLAIGHLFQLSRRIRHGSVHGPGAGSGRVLRTPDECFANLPDYPFEPHYWEHDGRRLHYIDEGAGQGDDGGEVVLMLHGEPTWSFLYRKVVPQLVAKGYRVVCPDALGMGKSDKPLDPEQYTFAKHAAAVAALCDRLGLGPDRCRLTLVLHDWGGVYGQAALPQIQPKRLVLLNTIPGPSKLPECGTDYKLALGFSLWSASVRAVGRDFDLRAMMPSMIFPSGSSDTVPAAVIDGYAAPFPGPEYKGLAMTWPLVYAHGPKKVGELLKGAHKWAWQNYEGPVLIAMGTSDALFNGRKSEPRVREWLAKASAIERIDIENASHFVSEAQPDAVAAAINGFIARHADV